MSMLEDPKAIVFAGLSLIVLFGGSVASLLLPAGDQVLGVVAAVGGYIACGRYALARWHADDTVFSHPSRTALRTFPACDEKRRSA